jgi:hypothetical protein
MFAAAGYAAVASDFLGLGEGPGFIRIRTHRQRSAPRSICCVPPERSRANSSANSIPTSWSPDSPRVVRLRLRWAKPSKAARFPASASQRWLRSAVDAAVHLLGPQSHRGRAESDDRQRQYLRLDAAYPGPPLRRVRRPQRALLDLGNVDYTTTAHLALPQILGVFQQEVPAI